MKRRGIANSIVVVLLVLAHHAAATVDLALYWEHATFTVGVGGKSRQILRVDAAAGIRNESSYLTSLRLRIGQQRILCPTRLISDLPWPQLGTLRVFYSGAQAGFDPHGDFSLRFSFGAEPVTDSRYMEAHIVFKAGKPVRRSFAIPEPGGWRYQDTAP